MEESNTDAFIKLLSDAETLGKSLNNDICKIMKTFVDMAESKRKSVV